MIIEGAERLVQQLVGLLWLLSLKGSGGSWLNWFALDYLEHESANRIGALAGRALWPIRPPPIVPVACFDSGNGLDSDFDFGLLWFWFWF